MNDLISIIVPVYNVEKYLKRCIDSCINQTYKNIEIILVDDGSLDECPRICDEYKEKDCRIKVIHKKNGGLSDARNVGIKESKGKYITFVDSDDYIDSDYIEYLYMLLKKYNTNLSICSYSAIYDNGRIITQANDKEYVISSHDALEKILYHEEFNVASVAKLYDKKLFKNVGFPVGKIHEDTYTTYKLIDQCDNISVGLKSKYNYMIRRGSILTSKFNINKLLLIDAYQEMGNYVLKKYPDLHDAVIRSIVYANISTLRQMINCKPRLKTKEKEIRNCIIKNKKVVLKNKRVSKRDKVAIILITISPSLFKISWNLYCKLTGRNC